MKYRYYQILMISFFSIFLINKSNFAGSIEITGESQFGRNKYIEYIPGNMPLIISVPHGGYKQPNEIENRDCGWNHSDIKCIELVKMIKDDIFAKTGKYPYIIINNLKRTKLDPNREEFEATCGDTNSLPYYYEYHKYIDSAKSLITKAFGKGLYVDLHGHNHNIPRLEIGYILDNSDLDKPDSILNDTTYIYKSSIKHLAQISGLNFSQLIRGDQSLGALFEKNGYPAVPSNKDASPGKEEFFQGGYDTDIHGSGKGGTIDAIQIETNVRGVRDTSYNIIKFASAFTSAILEYMRLYYIK
jgi:hypothetical protein